MKAIFLFHTVFFALTLLSTTNISYAAGTCGTTDYPCQNQSYTINGQIYCKSNNNATCTTGAGGSASATGFVYLSQCENGSGAGGTSICRLPSASLCASGYVFNDEYVCTKAECGPGYYGTATGTNNQGCTECTGKPSTAYYTTNNSCAWTCNNTYYRSSTSCYSCPSSADSGIYVNIYLNAGRPGATAGTSANTITNCYIPSGTYYDSTGTFTITGNCSYAS